ASYCQSSASLLTPVTICSAVSVGPDGNSRTTFCPVARIFTWVPPTSTTSTCMMQPPLRWWYALSLNTANGVLQGTYHSVLTHDDDCNPLNKKVYWTRGSVEGGPCINVEV